MFGSSVRYPGPWCSVRAVLQEDEMVIPMPRHDKLIAASRTTGWKQAREFQDIGNGSFAVLHRAYAMALVLDRWMEKRALLGLGRRVNDNDQG